MYYTFIYIDILIYCSNRVCIETWSPTSPSPIALCSRLILRLIMLAYTQRLFPQRCYEKLQKLWQDLRQSWWTEEVSLTGKNVGNPWRKKKRHKAMWDSQKMQ